MNSGEGTDRRASSRDPVSEAIGFLVMRDRPGFPSVLQDELAAMDERGDRLRHGDTEGWKAFYTDLSDLARRALATMESDIARSGSGAAGAGGSGSGVAVAGGPASNPAVTIRRYCPDIEKGDRDAVAYVLNERIPRQRITEVREAIESLTAGLPWVDHVEDGELVVEIEPDGMAVLNQSVQAIVSQWREKALAGMAARMARMREPVMAVIESELGAVGIPYPEPDTTVSCLQTTVKLPASTSVKLPSWPELAWRFFKSSFGMVSMLAGVVGTMLVMVTPSTTGSGVTIGQRALIVVWALPLLAIIATVYAIRGRRIERRKARARLQAELTRQIDVKLREAADNAMVDIRGAVKKMASESEQAVKAWWYKVERQFGTSGTGPVAVGSYQDEARRTPAGGVPVSQTRAMLSQIRDKILPALDARLRKFDAQA